MGKTWETPRAPVLLVNWKKVAVEGTRPGCVKVHFHVRTNPSYSLPAVQTAFLYVVHHVPGVRHMDVISTGKLYDKHSLHEAASQKMAPKFILGKCK
jgi:hypothetical protein